MPYNTVLDGEFTGCLNWNFKHQFASGRWREGLYCLYWHTVSSEKSHFISDGKVSRWLFFTVSPLTTHLHWALSSEIAVVLAIPSFWWKFAFISLCSSLHAVKLNIFTLKLKFEDGGATAVQLDSTVVISQFNNTTVTWTATATSQILLDTVWYYFCHSVTIQTLLRSDWLHIASFPQRRLAALAATGSGNLPAIIRIPS